MKITKAHKIRLNPTEEQAAYFWRAAGIARYVFNWGLARYNELLDYNREHLEDKRPVSGRLLKKEFNVIKPEWVSEVTCWAYQGAFDDLQKAFALFWHKHKNGTLPRADKPRKDGRPHGWPRFKSKHNTLPAFYLANTALKFDGYFFTFDKGRCGPVNMAEPLRFEGKVMGARVSYYANHWWLSVQVETEHESTPGEGAVGVDLGIKYLAVTSDGEIFDNPKPLQAAQRKLRRLQRSFARMEKGGQNWHKMKAKIAKLHFRVASIRNETSHEMTTKLARNYAVIGLEDLNVKGMTQNHRLARAISDAGLYEKRRQLEYKAAWNNGQVVTVSRWFPSSKTCNNCGLIKADLKLSDREWTCSNCGCINHRDGNAALNIRDEALRILQE